MEERRQFTFFESFFKATRRMEKPEREEFYDALVAYALYGTEPDLDALPRIVAVAMELIIPTLDSSRRKAENGKKGGDAKANGKQTGSKTKAKQKQTESKSDFATNGGASEKENEIEIEKEKENEIENECYTPSPLADAELSRVMTVYLDRFNSLPSSGCVEDLKAFTADLGADVVLHAFGRAQDEKKTGWSYIRGILQNYTRAGYRTLDAVLQGEAAFDAAKAKKAEAKAPATVQGHPVTPDDLERMQSALARMRGAGG